MHHKFRAQWHQQQQHINYWMCSLAKICFNHFVVQLPSKILGQSKRHGIWCALDSVMSKSVWMVAKDRCWIHWMNASKWSLWKNKIKSIKCFFVINYVAVNYLQNRCVLKVVYHFWCKILASMAAPHNKRSDLFVKWLV